MKLIEASSIKQTLTNFTLKNAIFTMLGTKNVTNYKNAFEAY
jgi:hypothetical protein